ncbi:hypothetical protein SLS62_008046 [Diatrype stigma]|uniref:Protein kinase domain-containing protein n=1 Tax=Diatrype stigma TaxID=117547 RepID=A0AAN9UYC8_9PEZI
MATWISRRSQILEMQRELHEWTEKLNLRLLSLPRQITSNVTNVYEAHTHNTYIQSSTVSNYNKLQEYLTLTTDAKTRRSKAMLLDNPKELVSKVRTMESISSLPMQHNNQGVILSCREVSANVSPGTPAFELLSLEMGELAAALSCLDAAMDTRLLKIQAYFYDNEGQQFLFIHQLPPCRVDSMMTLQELITSDPFPKTEATLSECIRIAYKIAEAVFFLHTAGFCHKNITCRSVVILRRFDTENTKMGIPSTIDEPYLMGFDLIRGEDAKTYKEGTRASKSGQKKMRGIWDFEVFQHPDRLQEDRVPRYSKTYDVYSLGVVLFNIGFWQPLPKVARRIDTSNPSSWAQELSSVSVGMRPRVGDRYQRMVQWCLNLTGDEAVKSSEFIQEILDPLEEMMSAMA